MGCSSRAIYNHFDVAIRVTIIAITGEVSTCIRSAIARSHRFRQPPNANCNNHIYISTMITVSD